MDALTVELPMLVFIGVFRRLQGLCFDTSGRKRQPDGSAGLERALDRKREL